MAQAKKGDVRMFEQEAEEYFRDNAHNFDEVTACRECMEYGYNKANEWHYLKDEFPPENVPLNIITFDKDKKRRLWEGEYKGGNGQWWTGYFNHFIDVPYAWKEIELPTE